MRSSDKKKGSFSCRAALRSLGILGLLLGPAIGVTASASTATAAEVAPLHAPAASSTAALPSSTADYGAREEQAKSLETFKGGDPVVIYTSTAVLIVAAVVLIILLI